MRRSYFREITALHNELSRLMNGLLQEGSAGNGKTRQSWVPAVDEVHVAKPEQPKPKKIPIGSSEQATMEA